MNKVKLSVVIITYNEEQNIARCLESVKDIADEIVVVDSFSTDRTEEICKKHSVKFIKNTFEGHIEQKNFAITQASYPHILSLDADEALSKALKLSVEKAKNNFDADGYTMNRLSSYCGKWIRHGRWYPDRKLRLWDSRKGSWQGQNPHDTFKLENGSKVKHLNGDILHYTYHTISQHTLQIHKFTDLSAQAAFNNGKRSSLIKIIGKPIFKFFADYFIKAGFLDGYYGFIIAIFGSYYKFMHLVKLKNIQQVKEKSTK